MIEISWNNLSKTEVSIKTEEPSSNFWHELKEKCSNQYIDTSNWKFNEIYLTFRSYMQLNTELGKLIRKYRIQKDGLKINPSLKKAILKFRISSVQDYSEEALVKVPFPY